MSDEQMPSRAISAGWDWPQHSDGPVAPQAGASASSWSNAPAAPQAPAPAQFAPPAGAPVNVAPAVQQSPYAPGHSGVTAASAAPAYGTPAAYPQQGTAQPMASYGQPSAYQAQPAPVAQPMQQAAAPQYGVNQQAAYASQPAQPTIDPHLQLAFSRLKSNATVAIVMSFVWFCTTPVILLLANAIRAQRLCALAREIDAPSDVTRKVNIARGIAFGMLLLQVGLIILLIVAENMR
ncbi:hypothetical protein [Actinomyces sp. HMSC035G02]|uniref:hypothetical protein n=1 Tax=Actinomyces sp. HMSC035G02 TaxID=1739406 RepID=UPI00114D1406|nr:hypothetical protein [Actinomyces sp. HMSC035G02]